MLLMRTIILRTDASMVPLSLGEGQDEGCFNGFTPHPSILLDGADKLYPLFSGRVSVSGLVTVLLVKYFEGFAGESETVCYHAVRYARAREMLSTALQPDLSQLGAGGSSTSWKRWRPVLRK